jgi:hypothetical protein
MYSCQYVYPAGEMVLSVKVLPDAAATTGYYTAAQHAAAGVSPLPGLGDAAFAGQAGSTVVRKDFKVRTVDVSKLPEQFDSHPSRAPTRRTTSRSSS